MMAETLGYDVLFITDHNKVWPSHALAGLREWSTRLIILPGIEISLPESMDILVLGASNPIYETLTTPGEIFAQASADGCLTVVAHPFRWADKLPEYCRLADAIELRTCNHPTQEQARQAQAYSERHQLAGLYASDAHGLNFLNRFWIETEKPFKTPEEFRRIVLTGSYENKMREDSEVLPPAYKAATRDELTILEKAASAE